MLCQQLMLIVAHGPARAVARSADSDYVLIWDATLIYLARERLLQLQEILDGAAAQPHMAISTPMFQWHPAPDGAALLWMGRTCLYLPQEDVLILHELLAAAAHTIRIGGDCAVSEAALFGPSFCPLPVVQADLLTRN